MTRVIDTPIAKIEVPQDRLRELQDYSELAESMSRVGLLQPITVNEAGVLVAGRHRLEAARSLGWETISAVVVEEDDLLNRLAEIDENLQRFDLTVYEQSKHAEERERVLEGLGQRATPKHNQHAPATVAGAKTTADIANEAGMSERSWRQRVKIGKGLGPKTKAALDQADVTEEKQRNFLNSTTQLNTVADISNKRGDDKAAETVERVLNGEYKNVYDAYPEIKKEDPMAGRNFDLTEDQKAPRKIGEFFQWLKRRDKDAAAVRVETIFDLDGHEETADDLIAQIEEQKVAYKKRREELQPVELRRVK